MAHLTLAIRGIGMISSAGISASQTCGSVAAGITRKKSVPGIYHCMADDPEFENGTPLLAAPISFLDQERMKNREPAEWLACIGEKAFSDLVESSEYTDDRDCETGLFISLPRQFKEAGPEMIDAFTYHFHNRIEKDLFPVEQYDFTGQTGVFSMIGAAIKAMADGRITRAIVGGVESSLFSDWLDALDRDYRIKSPRNIDGYVPGEAAAFLWLEKEGRSPKGDNRAFIPQGNKLHKSRQAAQLSFTPPGGKFRKSRQAAQLSFIIDELASDSGLNPLPGSALKNVVSSLLVESDETPIVFCDLNGESRRMEEWGFVRTGLGERLGHSPRVVHPADVLGDIGAATGAVLIIIAMYHLQVITKDPESALVWTASDSGERMAVRLRTMMGQTPD
jgi:3-oxoacyl-[acyl-carrier-protein] synthase-1